MEAGQGALFFNDPPTIIAPVVTAVQETLHQLGVVLVVKLQRLPRQRCTACGLRRVCFALSLEGVPGETLKGLPLCAVDAGIR